MSKIKRNIAWWERWAKPGSTIRDAAEKEVKRLKRIYNKRRARSAGK